MVNKQVVIAVVTVVVVAIIITIIAVSISNKIETNADLKASQVTIVTEQNVVQNQTIPVTLKGNETKKVNVASKCFVYSNIDLSEAQRLFGKKMNSEQITKEYLFCGLIQMGILDGNGNFIIESDKVKLWAPQVTSEDIKRISSECRDKVGDSSVESAILVYQCVLVNVKDNSLIKILKPIKPVEKDPSCLTDLHMGIVGINQKFSNANLNFPSVVDIDNNNNNSLEGVGQQYGEKQICINAVNGMIQSNEAGPKTEAYRLRKAILSGLLCQYLSGITPEHARLLTYGTIGDDKDTKEFILCLLKKIGIVNENGEIFQSNDELSAIWHETSRNEKSEIVAAACTGKKGKTPEDTAVLVYKCMKGIPT